MNNATELKTHARYKMCNTLVKIKNNSFIIDLVGIFFFLSERLMKVESPKHVITCYLLMKLILNRGGCRDIQIEGVQKKIMAHQDHEAHIPLRLMGSRALEAIAF